MSVDASSTVPHSPSHGRSSRWERTCISQRKTGGPTATGGRLFQPSWQPLVLQRTTTCLKPRRIPKLRPKLQSVNSDVALVGLLMPFVRIGILSPGDVSKPEKPKRLTERFCERVQPGPKVRFYGDAHSYGLRLRVLPSGHKSWTQRLTVRGKRRDLGLGSFPLVSLEQARSKAFENARAARAGSDAVVSNMTFRKVSLDCIALDAPSWKRPKYRADVETMMETYAYPQLGSRPVAGIGSRDIMAVLSPIWFSKPSVADRLLARLARTFDYAVAMGLRDDSPAAPGSSAQGSRSDPSSRPTGKRRQGTMRRCRTIGWRARCPSWMPPRHIGRARRCCGSWR